MPAFIILMTLPGYTETLFVWTIKLHINALLVGVMYSNALLLVVFALMQPSWERVRVAMVIITLFSVCATILTFFFLGPFLAHPWFHLANWLTMYLVLFLTHTAAYAWVLWDGDWLRTRPMFWQAPITGSLLMLLPLYTQSRFAGG